MELTSFIGCDQQSTLTSNFLNGGSSDFIDFSAYKHLCVYRPFSRWRIKTKHSCDGVQVKELGAVIYNCSCLAADLGKIFEAYWFLGESKSIPSPWPSSFSTLYNKDTPLQLPLNDTPSHVYLSVSCTHWKGRIGCLWRSFFFLVISLTLGGKGS